MDNPRPYFRCPFTLQKHDDGMYDLLVTTRDGTTTLVQGCSPELAASAVVEQATDDDTVIVTFGAPLYGFLPEDTSQGGCV